MRDSEKDLKKHLARKPKSTAGQVDTAQLSKDLYPAGAWVKSRVESPWSTSNAATRPVSSKKKIALENAVMSPEWTDTSISTAFQFEVETSPFFQAQRSLSQVEERVNAAIAAPLAMFQNLKSKLNKDQK